MTLSLSGQMQAVWLYVLLSGYLIGEMVQLTLTLYPCYVAPEVKEPVKMPGSGPLTF